MKELNNKLDGLSELVTRIDAKILDINTKLEELIKALHEYDDENIYSGYDEPNEALLKAAGLYNEAEANKRMDIIGQNGNEGSHYVTNEEADEDAATFNDYGMRVGKDKSNNSANTRVEEKLIGGYGVPNNVKTGVDKKRNKRKYYKPKQ
jgi:hypothetical protein